MIKKILNFTTNNKVGQIYLKEYNRMVVLDINTHLHDQTCENYINKLKDKHKDDPDDLSLIVVEYQLPKNKPDSITGDVWNNYKKMFSNIWGFKIINPKLF